MVPASRVAAAADAANDTNAAEQGRYGGAALDPGVYILSTFNYTFLMIKFRFFDCLLKSREGCRRQETKVAA